METAVEQQWISGFWRRIGALVLDTLVLGAVGFTLGLALESTFVQMGSWGRLVGFTIGLFYFGIGNSTITGGQTIGKRLLKLRVVNSNNTSIGIGKSVIRYLVLATPFALNGLQFSNEALQSLWIYPLSLVLFGGIFSIVYLYIFNRTTRQSLHDLAVGSFVVNVGVEKPEIGKVWWVHIIIVALLFVLASIGPALATRLAQDTPFDEMLAVQSALLAYPNVNYATFTVNSTTFSTVKKGTSTTHYVSSEIYLANNSINDSDLARQLAIVIVTNYPQALDKDAIQISLKYGFDIGIWSQWLNHSYSFLPEELQGGH
jgi:uncharacterized RDD family membrane protein YckC